MRHRRTRAIALDAVEDHAEGTRAPPRHSAPPFPVPIVVLYVHIDENGVREFDGMAPLVAEDDV